MFMYKQFYLCNLIIFYKYVIVHYHYKLSIVPSFLTMIFTGFNLVYWYSKHNECKRIRIFVLPQGSRITSFSYVFVSRFPLISHVFGHFTIKPFIYMIRSFLVKTSFLITFFMNIFYSCIIYPFSEIIMNRFTLPIRS